MTQIMDQTPSAPRPRRPRPALVTLTKAAADRVKEIMQNRPDTVLGLQIGIKQGGCAGQEYVMNYASHINTMDEVVESEGVKIVIDPKAILYLVGTEIDFEVTKLYSKFVFRNPNQTDACGCGESVTIVPSQELEA